MRLYVLLLAFCLAAGLNVMIASISDGGWIRAVVNHTIGSLTPILGYFAGTRVRDRGIGARNRLLLERLGRARDSFAGNSERSGRDRAVGQVDRVSGDCLE